MKICIITDAWKPIWGGGQEHIWQISNILAKEGFNITVLAPNLGPQSESYYSGNLKILRIGPKFTFPNVFGRALFLLSVLKFELLNDFDIYHTEASDAVIQPLVKVFKPKSKFIYTVHGAGQEILNGGLINSFNIIQKIWLYLIYKYPWDALLTAAKSTIKGEVKAKEFVVIGNGVNIDEIEKVKAQKEKGKYKVVWAGRIDDPIKGVKYLKEAADSLSYVDLELVTNKPHSEVIKALKKADLFVLPSLSEGLPLILLEAMAAGLPVVVTDVGDCREIVEKSGVGIIVEKGSSKALAEGIEVMYKSKNRKTGFNYIKDHYTWDKIAEIQKQVYEEATAN